jgi:hypothetical protein
MCLVALYVRACVDYFTKVEVVSYVVILIKHRFLLHSAYPRLIICKLEGRSVQLITYLRRAPLLNIAPAPMWLPVLQSAEVLRSNKIN